MTVTLYIEPKSFMIFLEITRTLKNLQLENTYSFNPSDITFSETFVSNYVAINMDVAEYLKLRYCMGKLTPQTTK